MALYLSLIGFGWLLAACSAVLWLRRHPGRTFKLKESDQGWQSTLLVAAIGAGAYGGVNLVLRYHWGGWLVPAVYVPLFVIGTAAPILTRRWQLRHSTRQTSGLDSSAGIPPTA